MGKEKAQALRARGEKRTLQELMLLVLWLRVATIQVVSRWENKSLDTLLYLLDLNTLLLCLPALMSLDFHSLPYSGGGLGTEQGLILSLNSALILLGDFFNKTFTGALPTPPY